MSFLYSYDTMEVCRKIGLCMKERLIGVADDRMIEIALLFLYRLMFG